MISSDFRAEARRKLSGKWGKVACISLAYALVFFVLGMIEALFPDSMEPIFSIITVVIEIPLTFGIIISYMKLYKDEDVKAFDFFTLGFSNFARSWKVSLHTLLKMIVPVILIIVSCFLILFSFMSGISSVHTGSADTAIFDILIRVGVILFIFLMIWTITKSYYYKMAYFVAVDNSDLTAKEAVEKSQELMTGKRAKLFWLELSFIGWSILIYIPYFIGCLLKLPYIVLAILSFVTVCVAFLLLVPYIQFATIAFYKFVSGDNSNVEAKVVTENNDNPIQGE